MSLRDKNGAAEDPPFKPQPVKPPSDADIKKYKEILEKRKSGRENRKSKKPAGGAAPGAAPPAPAGAATSGESCSLESFFEGLVELTDGTADQCIGAVALGDAPVTPAPHSGSASSVS